jgi:hypothetical protein
MSSIKLRISGDGCSFGHYLTIMTPLLNITKKEKDLLTLLYEANSVEITTESRNEAFAMSEYSSKAVMNNVIKSIRDKKVISSENQFHDIIKSYDPELKEITFSF